MLGYEYVTYVNALEICNLDLLSARREIHCLNFARSLLKSERTKMLIPPSRQAIHGRQLRNSTNITQLRARTNRFAQSPIPYYIGLLNSSQLVLLVAFALHPTSGVFIGILGCLPLLIFAACILFFFLFVCVLMHCMTQFGPWAAMLC